MDLILSLPSKCSSFLDTVSAQLMTAFAIDPWFLLLILFVGPTTQTEATTSPALFRMGAATPAYPNINFLITKGITPFSDPFEIFQQFFVCL